jgi:unsaturated rhamnogalacturonyl hydrolase
MQARGCFDTAVGAFHKHVATHPLAHYTGILSMHGYARLGIISGNPAVLDEARQTLLPFVRGERAFKANFTNYFCGGNGTAYLHWLGKLPAAAGTLRHYAEDFFQAPRSSDGILRMPNSEAEKVWIDTAFAVTPFMLFCGLAFDEERYIRAGYDQIDLMYHLLRDPDNGLLHQARGFTGPGVFSQDHWSRGNGWGILALTELVQYLPERHACRPGAEAMFTALVEACLRVQDEQGMWHQEMTDHDSYVETSGTGLILYAIGAGLEKGLLPDSVMEPYLRGLRGYSQYISPDGTVYHTCRGCLNPGKGTIADYKQRPPVINDSHAFGPVILAFGQAMSLGIDHIV